MMRICVWVLASVSGLSGAARAKLSIKSGGSLQDTVALSRTVGGCQCRSNCGSRREDDFYRCDRCRVEGNCGQWSLFGRWDWCDYSADASFERKSYKEKLNYLWQNIIKSTEWDEKDLPSSLSALGGFTESMMTTFDNYNPEMPAGRTKVIHGVGSVCQVDLKIKKSRYTGLLARGTQKGLIRIGSAVSTKLGGITPGLGWKFPRSGVTSGDLVTLNALDIPQSWNFFATNMSNHIAAPTELATQLLAKKFEQASQCAPQVGLRDFTSYTQSGKKVSAPKFPFKLFMIPSADIQMDTKPKTATSLHAIIDAIPVGTKLYTVYGCSRPSGAEIDPMEGGLKSCGGAEQLGTVVTTSKCTVSNYGDKHMHIRHDRIEKDWELRPDFFKSGAYSAQVACGRSPRDHIVTVDGAPEPCGQTDDQLHSDV